MRDERDHSRRRRNQQPEDSRKGTSGLHALGGDARLSLLLVCFAFLLCVVAGRLFWLQVVRGNYLATQAEDRRSNVIKLQARRGTIFDRNGNVLAMSEECRTVYCNPLEITEPYLTAEVIAEHLGGTTNDYVDTLTGTTTFAYVSRKVATEDAEELKAALTEKKLPGIYYLEDSRRVYPYGNIGGQVLGIVGVDGDGLSGLELYYDDILGGIDGEMIVEAGVYGTPIAGAAAKVTQAVDGTDLVISLDINVQRLAEEVIVEGIDHYDADSGSVMVTDPTTGEILAACSTPLLDPTDLSVVEEGATSLKMVSDSYEPGSTFKVVTAAIGINEGVFDPSTTYYVPAYLMVGDNLVGDDDGRGEDMYMTLREILRRSSNAGAALVAQESIGADAFAAGIEAFGMGELTGIDYPGEVAGIVRSRSEYDGSSVGSMAFGQGLAFPQVQLVRAVGVIANAGVASTPHFLIRKGTEEVTWESGDQVISANAAREVTDMMRTVVEEGTAVAAQVQGYDVAAKTGTGEVADTTKGGYVEGSFTSSLIGFAPAGAPRVLVYVGLNGTPYHGGDSAGPLFASIMSEALTDMGVLPAT